MNRSLLAFAVSSLLAGTAKAVIDPNYSYEIRSDADLVDFSSYLTNVVDPDTCRSAGDRCWQVSQVEGTNQFSDCCQDVTNGNQVLSCVGNAFYATCQWTTDDPSQSDPKGEKGVDWGVYDLPSAGTNYDSCPAVANLGPLFSKSTGFTSEPFPLLSTPSFLDEAYGRESEIGFFVGGNYYAEQAAEIEGNIVVLGDFEIGPDGTNSIGTLTLT